MDTKEPPEAVQQAENKEIQRIALYGFLLNFGLSGLKAILAFLSGSLAITASAIDSATDSIASVFLYMGLKLSARKTPTFPLGLYKLENLLSVVLAFFIFFAGYEIGRRAFSPAATLPDISLMVVVLIAGATMATFLFGRYAIAAGRRTESPTLIAEGRHRQVDALASFVVLVSVVISYFKVEIGVYGITLDQIAAAVVLVFIAHTGWELLSGGMRVLLDTSIDHETLSKVRKIIEAEPLVADVESLVGRNAGRFRFLQATVTLRTDDLQRAHRISETIEANIHKRVPHVERVVIHYEPQVREYVRLAIPLTDPGGNVSSHLGGAPYFALAMLRLSDHEVEKQEIIKNPYAEVEKGKGIRVAEWLTEKKVDEVVVTEEVKHKGPGYVFSDGGVKVHVVAAKDVGEAIGAVTGKDSSQ